MPKPERQGLADLQRLAEATGQVLSSEVELLQRALELPEAVWDPRLEVDGDLHRAADVLLAFLADLEDGTHPAIQG